MKSSKPQEGTGELKASEEIFAILIIPDKNGPALGKPRQCPLHNPATSWVFPVPVFVKLLLANATDMGYVACRLCCAMASGVVIAFVQAEVLWGFRGRLWPRNDNSLQSLCKELGIMNIGTSDCDSRRTSTGLGDKTDLGSWFTTVCRVSSDLVATKASLAHSPIRRLPFPIHSSQFLALFEQDSPNPCKNSVLAPSLKPTMGCAVISQLFGQVVPLHSRTGPIDDCVDYQPKTTSSTSPSFGRISFAEYFPANAPECFWNFPYGRQLAVWIPAYHASPPMLSCQDYG